MSRAWACAAPRRGRSAANAPSPLGAGAVGGCGWGGKARGRWGARAALIAHSIAARAAWVDSRLGWAWDFAQLPPVASATGAGTAGRAWATVVPTTVPRAGVVAAAA